MSSKASTSWASTATAVLWAFLGVRRRTDFERDLGRLTPLRLAVVGVIAALIFVFVLLAVVAWVVGDAPGASPV